MTGIRRTSAGLSFQAPPRTQLDVLLLRGFVRWLTLCFCVGGPDET